METLVESLQKIFEAFNIAPVNINEFNDFLKNHNNKPQIKKFNSINNINKFIELLFDSEFIFNDNTLTVIPFRCSNSEIKIARMYQNAFVNIIPEECKKFGIIIKSNPKNNSIILCDDDNNEVSILFGDGSSFSNRAIKGLTYENIVIKEFIEFIQIIGGMHNINQQNIKNKFSENNLQDIFKEHTNFRHIFSCYNYGGMDSIIEEYINNPDIDLTEYITLTGKTKIFRNKNKELFDKNFNITDKDIESVLHDSGEIIADITIKGNPNQYISIKLKESQLSGVVYNDAMKNNDIFNDAINNKTEYSDIQNNKGMIPYINLCNTLGIDPEIVYDCYKTQNFKKNITNTKNFDENKLGILLQKLIGGNYWYVNPQYCIFIPDTNKKLSFKLESTDISDGGKTIKTIGHVNNVKCSITFRTDGRGIYPYRIFPILNIKELLDTF